MTTVRTSCGIRGFSMPFFYLNILKVQNLLQPPGVQRRCDADRGRPATERRA